MADLQPLLPGKQISPSMLRRIGVPSGPIDTIDASPSDRLLSMPAITQYKDNITDTDAPPTLPPLGQAAMGGGLQSLLPSAAPQVSLNNRIGDSNGSRQSLLEADLYKRDNPIAPTTTLGKIGHVAAGIGNVLGNIFAPATMALIPGTELHSQIQKNRDIGELDDISSLQNQEAQRKQLEAKADDMTPFVMSREQAASLNQPGLAGTTTTMRDFNKALVGAGHDTTNSGNNMRTNDTRQSISDDKLEAAAKTAAAKPEQRDDHYIAIMAKPAGERTADDLSYKQGYEGYIKAKMTDPRVAAALVRPVQVVLPNGQAGYETAGTAIKTGATGLGDNAYKAEGAALKDFTSGTDSHTLTAFNTAKGHLQQLATAGDALQNGDVPALNKLANAYGVATGQAAPAVFQGVKTAVSGEIAKAFTGAGATVDEINEIRKSINDANSPEQLHSVVTSYSHLLDTKSAALRSQFSAAKKGQANFSDTGGNSSGTIRARDKNGILHEAPAGTPLPSGWKQENK